MVPCHIGSFVHLEAYMQSLSYSILICLELEFYEELEIVPIFHTRRSNRVMILMCLLVVEPKIILFFCAARYHLSVF